MEAVPRARELSAADVVAVRSPASAAGWHVDEMAEAPAVFHAREPVAGIGRLAWWCRATAPALVLGSAQPAESVDAAACARAGIDVVRRRSGGGAVLVLRGELVWLDVVVPRGDPLWQDDVGRAMWWFGDVWRAALASVGVAAEVHRGHLERTRWSPLVCFDGMGPGEVVVGDEKAVGISQRRTREWARLQAAVHIRWRPDLLVSLLEAPGLSAGELRPVWSSTVDAARLQRAVEEQLGRV